jgi:hypothetical protein
MARAAEACRMEQPHTHTVASNTGPHTAAGSRNASRRVQTKLSD